MRKVGLRLVPFLMLCYVVAYLDRVNVGFAKLQMSQELGFSETVYGLGAGLFFIGYFLFEVPSNVILHRVGARVAWRHMSDTAVAAGMDVASLARFAELVFAYIDQLSASSVAGHTDELDSTGRVRRHHLERLGALLADASVGLLDPRVRGRA